MQKDEIFKHDRLSTRLLALIAILLGFLLLLVFIWLWYDLNLAKLNKEQPSEGSAIHSNK
jgi:hypothetical protein